MDNKGFSYVIVLFLVAFLIFTVVQVLSGGMKLSGVASLFKSPWTATSSVKIESVTTPSPSQGNSSVPAKSPEPEKPKIVPPQGFKESDLSPYYKKVRISSVRPPSMLREFDASFILEVESNVSEPITVTGWKLRGNRKEDSLIPQAIADFDSSTSLKGNITLQGGQSVTVYSWRKQSSVPNIRLNKCTGFLNDTYAFYPDLPNDCPRVEDARTVSFSGQCQNFVRSLSSCKIPTSNEMNQFTSELDRGCHTILEQQNYASCYRAHRNDIDFFSREWRVWLGEWMMFDPFHDHLILLDKDGLVVNEYIY